MGQERKWVLIDIHVKSHDVVSEDQYENDQIKIYSIFWEVKLIYISIFICIFCFMLILILERK
jgi:hypothetical protein